MSAAYVSEYHAGEDVNRRTPYTDWRTLEYKRIALAARLKNSRIERQLLKE